MKRYNPSEIEPKWQKIWSEQKANQATEDEAKPKMYVSGMFPYPSGAGMHAGHAFSYSVVDAIARFYRQHGYDVMNPIGWDAFGLPAENYAIKTGTSPIVATTTNIANFKNQFRRLGISFDWSREINTSDPEYYHWTQWIFTKLFERGLAYQKESLQWWCPVDKTVLANEQVEGGHCWRCGSLVEKKSMKQWFFKITDYAQELLDEIPDLDWPDKIKIAQTNWIGKSEGAEIDFKINDSDNQITVFSTRPDTLFGATFVVLAPEHPLSRTIATPELQTIVNEYIDASIKKSEIERMNDNHEKTGVFTGRYAINPANGNKIQIWIADYVLSGYGTGAVMAVPAHDDRDLAFAEKFGLPVIEVVEQPETSDEPGAYHGEGLLVNSGQFDGMNSSDAREQVVAWLEQQKLGRSKITYKMRDWLISRQRYWGAPIPIIHCPKHGAVSVPEDQLPVLLPEINDYAPKGDGKTALARDEEWVNTTCPICGGPAKRETDTMDGYACSSWYLLRYTDPHNKEAAWDPNKVNHWAPVDYYVGGDHAVAHLLYVRFWTHVFHDMGLTAFKEPINKLVYHGYINAEDGTKMSKSKGNVIDPLDIINQGYGADALRTYVLFMGPIEINATWSSHGIAGVYRFLNRIWVLVQEYIDQANDKKFSGNDDQIIHLQNKVVKKATTDFYRLNFNTAISAMMEYVNELYKFKVDGFSDQVWRKSLLTLLQLIAPLAPHLADELWQQLDGQGLIQDAAWPIWDDKLIIDETVTIVVQVNGKLRSKIEVERGTGEDKIKQLVLSDSKVKDFLADRKITKLIYVPDKLVNIVL
jgi:leucyl-tRNA synthetase